MKDELFYFENGNILCYIYGYYSGYTAIEFAELIKENVVKLQKLTGCSANEVKLYEIRESRRYKGMIAFMVETTIVPNDAYVVELRDGYWNVTKWLTD